MPTGKSSRFISFPGLEVLENYWYDPMIAGESWGVKKHIA